MSRPLASVRARAALAATMVVCLALVVAGFGVVAVLRHNLAGRAGLEAEVTARTVAGSQDALNGRFDRLDLPEDGRVVQVVDSAGHVLGAGAAIAGRAPVADYAPAADSSATPPSTEPSPPTAPASTAPSPSGPEAVFVPPPPSASGTADATGTATHANSGAGVAGGVLAAVYVPVRTGATRPVVPVDDHGRRGQGADDSGGSGKNDDGPATSDGKSKEPTGDDHGGRGGDDSGSGGSSEDSGKSGATSSPPRGKVGTDVQRRTIRATVAGGTHDYSFAAVQGTTYDGSTYTVYAGVSLEEEQATLDQVTKSLLSGLPFLLLVVAAVTWLVTRHALKPVEGIRAEMAEITGSGHLSRRVPEPRSGDEIARLARTTNQTLAALERSVERQHRFIADASHELRSPIANLRTQLEVADAHPELLDTHDLVQDIVRLQHLATDLLLLARLDAGESPAGARLDLADLVREEVAARAATDRFAPAVTLEGESLAVTGSRTQLVRVLANLLDNAQRHASGAVEVTVAAESDEVVLTVADDGPGVAPEDRERVFERFVRLDEGRSRDAGGAGLGLAIARDVVLRHGGSLTVEGDPGEGAVFRARLPRAT
ncbi:sensor histidine kinase [Streptomyces sp. NRRL S-813]|uniref:sensor histidine kinase n=1 Tax=Streptomyces sp. NRRL S-813 TaxID=1463919 RepID=UPI000565BEC5|nr:HAMP domain-containing sensor histidine kinase [Streptomyces sp. NRRL S-813]